MQTTAHKDLFPLGVVADSADCQQLGRALRVDGSTTVHLAGSSRDHRGEELPAPACHTGIAGWDPRRLRASDAPVTCRRCLRLIDRRQIAVRVSLEHLTLW